MRSTTPSPSPSPSLRERLPSREHTAALQTLSRLSTDEFAEKPFAGLVICVTGLSKGNTSICCCYTCCWCSSTTFFALSFAAPFLSTFLLLLPSNVVDPTSRKRYVCPSHVGTIASWASSELSFLVQHSPRTCSSTLWHFTVSVLLVESYLRARVAVGLWSGHWMTLKRFSVIVCGEGLYILKFSHDLKWDASSPKMELVLPSSVM
jgi:hypothetical protein